MQTKELQGSLAVLGALIFDQLDPNLLCSLHQTTQSLPAAGSLRAKWFHKDDTY